MILTNNTGINMHQTLDRKNIKKAFTFDLEAMFLDTVDCENQMNSTIQQISGLVSVMVNPAESALGLLNCLIQVGNIEVGFYPTYLYSLLQRDIDRENTKASKLFSRATEILQRLRSAVIPLDEALKNLTEKKWQEFVESEPKLREWHYHYQVCRKRSERHVSLEIKSVITEIQALAAHAAQLDQKLNHEIDLGTVQDFIGNVHSLTLDNISQFYKSQDEIVRKNTGDAYHQARYRHRSSSTSFLYQFMRTKMIEARLNGYSSNLEASFDEADIDPRIFQATLGACAQYRTLWNRYWSARKRLLKLDSMRTYDLGLGVDFDLPSVSYEQAVSWIVEAVQPLGADYAAILKRGLTVDRWVDIYPTRGKVKSAYSYATNGTKPYIMISFKDDFASLSTLAHESGHAMHSYLMYATQPCQYTGYGVTAAETAANTHQALLFSYLRNNGNSLSIKRASLTTELRVSKNYMMQMPLNATFEHELYSRIWAGEGFDADVLSARYLELSKTINGSALELSDADAINWLDEPVLYKPYSALQYTFGIAGAQAIAERILAGEAGAVEGYLQFLKSGQSMEQLDSLALAGIDFSTSNTIDRAFQRIQRLIEEMEVLDPVNSNTKFVVPTS
jgi:oligoendopeptidase F